MTTVTKFVVAPDDMPAVKMRCVDEEGQMRDFYPTLLDPKTGEAVDYVCDECGWQQYSYKGGIYELLMNATWHNLKEYRRQRNRVLSEYPDVPEFPNKFEE